MHRPIGRIRLEINLHDRTRIAELGIGQRTPDLALPDEGQRVLRVRTIELPGQAVAVIDRVQDLARHMAVSDPVNRCEIVLFPLIPVGLELGEDLAVRDSRSHQDDAVALGLDGARAFATR